MSQCEYGRIAVTVDGARFSARGPFEIKPNNFEREAGLNYDGTPFTTVKPVPAMASGSFDACSIENFDALLNACDLTVVIEFGNPANPVTWVFSQAVLTGRPSLNSETGEVTDVVFESPSAVRG